MNVSLGLVFLCLLWQRDPRHINVLIKHPLVWLPAMMFLLLALSLTGQHDAYGPEMVDKYKKLLYVLPLALFFLHNRLLAARFLNGFLLANGVILAISLAVGVLNLPLGHISPSNPTVFKLHITQNYFMALAALAWLSRAYAGQGLKRWGYASLAGLACYDVLFLVLGRTGYVALAVGLGVWLWVSLSANRRWAVAVCGLAAVCVLAIVPNRATERVLLGVAEIHHCLTPVAGDSYDSCSSSMGQRTIFALKALNLIKQAPLLGHGAGGFWYGNPETGYHINNPHNEYLLVAVQCGLAGLALFLAWMFCCYRIALRQPNAVRNLLIAVLSGYMACHLFNSFLLDSAEGHLFVIIAAILAGYSRSSRRSAAYEKERPLL